MLSLFQLPRPVIYTEKELLRTQPGGPSCPIEPKVCFGSYCMRVQVPLIKDKTGDTISNFYGYDDTPSITHDVVGACEIRRREGQTCGPAKLSFISEMPNCNGLITQEEHDGTVKIIRYNK